MIFRAETGGVRRQIACALAAAIVAGLPLLGLGASPASATSYVPVSGAGSSWSANALDQWIADVQQYGMRVNYADTGSTAGRQAFLNGTADFAASDIPFQTDPTDGFSTPEDPTPGTYAYMPITAGGTVFMYNLMINGQRVTNLRLSGPNIAKIFTGAITNWDNPAIAADNPGLQLPNEPIVPVVRSDGAGSSFELSEWMISQYPSIWNAFCNSSGRAPACGPTSFWPSEPGMIAQSGDLGVAGYVSQGYGAGSIGYVEYSYALDAKFPVVQMLNSAGYYTEPTAQNVAVSLLAAQIETANTNPAVYLTENLTGVYTDPDPRTYPLSSYSYLILPTTIQGQFSAAKGTTLAAFSYYAMCQGQQESAQLGYSPMPINLVEASFTQIAKIPGANVQTINIQSCNNPTFTPSGANLLAQTAPYPPACDKQGPTQCTTGTGGAAKVATPVSSPTAKVVGSTAVAKSAGPAALSGGSQTTTVGAATGPTSSTDSSSSASTAPVTTTTIGDHPTAVPITLAVTKGWSSSQTLIALVVVVLLALLVVPGMMVRRRMKRREP